MAGIVKTVESGSIAQEAGIEPGDALVAVDGRVLRDAIDYRYLVSEERIRVDVRKPDGSSLEIDIEKDRYEDLGIEFAEILFDGERSCRNRCTFCFVDQLPAGVRSSLLVRDDDYRLSFLQGNFVTLTNLDPQDWDRIVAQRLSPLYISVHSMNPGVREALLKNRKARLIGHQLQWLAQGGIEFHAQFVVCPGVNDGNDLLRSISALLMHVPALRSIAVVPVGLTGHRIELDSITPVNSERAGRLLDSVERVAKTCLDQFGSRMIWCSDEIYLLAGRAFPSYGDYEDFPQLENGVGVVAQFLRDWRAAGAEWSKRRMPVGDFSIATGILAAPVLRSVVERINDWGTTRVSLFPVENHFFGSSVTAAGLVTGKDLIGALEGKPLGERLCIPSVMLRRGMDVFLDDMAVGEVERALNVTILRANSMSELFESLAKSAGKCGRDE